METVVDQKNIFNDKQKLEQINQNFSRLTLQAQNLFPPRPLPKQELVPISEEFFATFNGSDQSDQIRLLGNAEDTGEIWYWIMNALSSYSSSNFLDELYILAKKALPVKQHLTAHLKNMLLTLGICYNDEIRDKAFKILLVLLGEKDPENKSRIRIMSKLIYESLYSFDVYYECIKHYTPESIIISLCLEETNLFCKGTLSKDLKNKIEISIQQLGGSAFFKLQRSPKDCFSAIDKEIKGEWNQIWGVGQHEDPTKCFMRIKNSEQLLLLCKHSVRLQQDLNEFQDNGIKIILRKWEALGTEFRCFVCKGQLNAVSGYNFEETNGSSQEEFKTFVNSRQFIDIIVGIPYSHGVIDCCIDNDYKVKILEINPFGKMASAAKFSWVIDKDLLNSGFEKNHYAVVKI